MVMQQNKSSMFNVIKAKQKPLVRRQRRRNEDVQFGETLANKGIIQLWGEITAESIYPAATQMMEYNFMDEEDAPAQISLFIDSVGGDVFSTYHLIDLIKQSDIPVATIGMGCIASGGVMLLMAGTPGRRYITENTYIMSHQYSTMMAGKEHELKASFYEVELQSKKMINHYRKCTKKSESYIRKHLLAHSDASLSPEEAIKHGLADQILTVY